MGKARDKAGNIWETDAQGNAIRLLQPAQAASGRVVTLPPSPEKVAQQALQAAADERANRAEARADRAEKRASAPTLPAGFRWKNGVVGGEAERIPGADSVGGKPPTEYQAKSAGFLGRLLEAERLFGAVPESSRDARTVPGQWFHEALPGVENSFNSADRQKADQAARNFIAASLRQESGAAISQGEFDNQYRIFFPMPGDGPEVIAQKAEARRQAIEGFKVAAGPLADQIMGSSDQHADNEVPGQVTGGLDKPPPGADGGPPDLPPANQPGGNDPTPITPASGGGTQTIAHPEINSMVQSMLAAGAGYSTINAALKTKNAAPISFTEYNRAKTYMAAHPGQAYPVNATEERPLSLMERVAGSGAGAFAANFANSATAGIPEYLAGDQGRGALEAMGNMHGTASTLGSIGGGILGAAAGEGILAAKAPLALAKYAPRMADAAYGAVSGYTGAEDGNRGLGALEGAILAPIAGKVGEKVIGAAGAVANGVTDPAVQYLRGLNIPLTVGQALSNSGRAGSIVKKLEDAATSIPGVGNVINARRNEGLQSFNKAAFDLGAETTGDQVQNYGAAGLRDLQDLVGQSYRKALDPVTIDANAPQFVGDMANTVNAAKAIPNVNSAQDAALAALQTRIGGAVDPITETLSGRAFQEAYRGLARTGRERAGSDYGHEVGQVMRQGQDALATALEEQNPGAYQGFLNANAANRRMNILADALGTAKNQEDGLFTPAQLNSADFRNASRLTSKVAAATGDRPFAELANAGQAVLPSKLPNSGTADRLWTGALLGGAMGGGAGYATGDTGTGAMTGLGTTLALMAGGSRPAQARMVKLLADHPDWLRSIGASLKDYSPYAGIVTTPGAAALLNAVNGQ